MADFTQEVELTLSVPSRELSSAREQIEGALSDVPVSLDNGAAAQATGGGSRQPRDPSSGQFMSIKGVEQRIVNTNDLLADLVSTTENAFQSRSGSGRGVVADGTGGREDRRMRRWARQRTEDIADILDLLQNADLAQQGGGGGDGWFPKRLPNLGSIILGGGGLLVTAGMLVASKASVTAADVVSSGADVGSELLVAGEAVITAPDVIASKAAVTAADVVSDAAGIGVDDVIGAVAAVTAADVIASKAVISAADVLDLIDDGGEGTGEGAPSPPPVPQGPRNPFNDVVYGDDEQTTPSPPPTPTSDDVGLGDKLGALASLPVAMTARGIDEFTPASEKTSRDIAVGGTLAAGGVAALGAGGTLGAATGLAALMGGAAGENGGQQVPSNLSDAEAQEQAMENQANITVDNSTDIQVETSRDDQEIIDEAVERVEREVVEPMRRDLERNLRGR